MRAPEAGLELVDDRKVTMNTYLPPPAPVRLQQSLSLSSRPSTPSQVTDTFVSSQLDNISWPEQHPHLTTGA
jgi:hypothetical protein